MISYLDFEKNRSLSTLSTFRIGGPCDYFIEVKEIDKLIELFKFCKKENLAYQIVGKGSNSLFSDHGFRGVVILNKLDFLEAHEGQFRVGAGYSFSLLGAQTAKQGWMGLEFASGIPASVGGAVFMNAGANGRETCDFLRFVEFLHDDGSLACFTREELTFGYRHSPFQEMKGMILAATFKLEPNHEARQKQLEIIDYRKKTQPLQEPSVGCIFRNPECSTAGQLIEKAGLKGFQVGGVKVSEKHANFIVNTGDGKAGDVVQLIKIIKERVFLETGVTLQEEVRFIDER